MQNCIIFLNRYDDNTRLWIATVFDNKDFLATSRAPLQSLLLGTHLWTIHNDSIKCARNSISEPNTVMMTLTGCSHSEFTCSDGNCVSMDARCDDKLDCADETDEDDCSLIIHNSHYKKEIVPPTINDLSKLRVNVTVDIENIGKIDVVDGVIEIMYKLTRTWYDSRLLYQNLNINNNLNKLSEEDIDNLWFPLFSFKNIASPDSYEEAESSRNWTVIRNKSYIHQKADKTENKNIYLFEGSQNYIECTKLFSTVFNCEYDLSWYPFDTQVCSMKFEAIADVEIEAQELAISGSKKLAQYEVLAVCMCTTYEHGVKLAEVKIKLSRPLLNNILTVFIPTVIIVIISHMAKYFEENYVDMVIQVNLTAILVLANL